jgi:hypothetical protein
MTDEGSQRERGGQEGKDICCPFCSSSDTELYSLFGSQLSTSQYYCNSCRVAFEAIKWRSKGSAVE